MQPSASTRPTKTPKSSTSKRKRATQKKKADAHSGTDRHRERERERERQRERDRQRQMQAGVSGYNNFKSFCTQTLCQNRKDNEAPPGADIGADSGIGGGKSSASGGLRAVGFYIWSIGPSAWFLCCCKV